MKTSLKTALITAGIAILVIALASCTVTTAPDGTRTSQPDYNAWLEITRLILADEVPQARIVPTK